MKRQLTAVVIGAGNRGETYTDIMANMPEKFKLVAVAEPIESRRKNIQAKHNIPDEMCFEYDYELLAEGKLADVAIISTMDRQHFEPAMKAISLGYDILLEKPVSPEPAECEMIAKHAAKHGVRIVVCHVLRYTPFFITLKQLIQEGQIGEVVSINHEECVGNVHQSHSFVRGNWGNTERSSCMLLQKSCHDMDILQWLLDKKCEKVQSFGSLTHFRKENAPVGSSERCIEGCPHGETCPYNAVKIYLDDKKNDWFRTTCARVANPTDADIEKALRTTQYGKCVYKCDNDVVDHQTVNMLFEDGITVTFTMNAFNRGGRHIHIMGTKGEIHGDMRASERPIQFFDFETRQTYDIELRTGDDISSGHGGGDEGIVHSIYDYFNGDDSNISVSDIRTSVDNHLIVFAAEKARAEMSVIDLETYKRGLQ